MDPTLRTVLGICMRWIHIASVVTLVGSYIYARFILTPALAALGDSIREAFHRQVMERFRPLLYILIITILGSGLYNYLTKSSYPPGYHMWIGIKFLLVLHIFAVTILYTLPGADEGKRNRWLTGMVYSAFAIIAISAWLRWTSLSPVVKLP